MPAIARFYGLVIKMFFGGGEHNPPHFHVSYGEYSALIDIKTLQMIEGDLPDRALSLVKEWGKIHKNELLDIWNKQEFSTLPPLE